MALSDDRAVMSVMNSVMPKGVEHSICAQLSHRARCRVMNSVMPKGVEHHDADRHLCGRDERDEFCDAERR